jgi:hypothetical protein
MYMKASTNMTQEGESPKDRRTKHVKKKRKRRTKPSSLPSLRKPPHLYFPHSDFEAWALHTSLASSSVKLNIKLTQSTTPYPPAARPKGSRQQSPS